MQNTGRLMPSMQTGWQLASSRCFGALPTTARGTYKTHSDQVNMDQAAAINSDITFPSNWPSERASQFPQGRCQCQLGGVAAPRRPARR